MPGKKLILVGVVLSFFSVSVAKSNYRPPLRIENVVSDEVRTFLDTSLSQDLDLFVYQNNQLIAFSNSSDDPFEVVDFTASSNADLTITIYRFANSGDDDVILGYSFWNDL